MKNVAWHLIFFVSLSLFGCHATRSVRDIVPIPFAHSHNDYEQLHPLSDAMGLGFTSVEADVFLQDGELLVGHELLELRAENTLERLYLKPLSKWIERHNGHVYATRGAFYLFIDVKTEADATYEALNRVLQKYSNILTHVKNGAVHYRPVTAVISGNRAWNLVATSKTTYLGLDGRLKDLDSDLPSHRLPIISDNWREHFAWTGSGEFPRDQQMKLRSIVQKAHQRDRKVRFWATPNSPIFWRTLHREGVDLINADALGKLKKFAMSL